MIDGIFYTSVKISPRQGGPAAAVLLDSNLGVRQRPPKWAKDGRPWVGGYEGEPRAERPPAPASFREVPAVASGERYAGGRRQRLKEDRRPARFSGKPRRTPAATARACVGAQAKNHWAAPR
jgi:hypothetical protein